MSEALRLGSISFALNPSISIDDEAAASPEVLRSEELEHGAYYSGQVGSAAAVARWHAAKRRFVYGEYTMGKQHIRLAPHIYDAGTAASFSPVTRTQPKDAHRISDYAFETAR